jgi:hypothetical protein
MHCMCRCYSLYGYEVDDRKEKMGDAMFGGSLMVKLEKA